MINPSDLENTIEKLIKSTGFKEGDELSIIEQSAENGSVEDQMYLAHQASGQVCSEDSFAKAYLYILASNQGDGEAQAKRGGSHVRALHFYMLYRARSQIEGLEKIDSCGILASYAMGSRSTQRRGKKPC